MANPDGQTAETSAPRVSVVMPVYNAQRYLAEAVQSILHQTFRDFELIAVDDGSKDNSLAMLQEFARSDPRVRIISRPNTGIVGALNDGVAAARGEFVARMDADDIALPERLEKQIAFMEKHSDCAACGGKAIIISPEGIPIEEQWKRTGNQEIQAALFSGDDHLCHPATLIRRDLLLRAGSYRREYEWVEDLDLWLRLGEIGELANLTDVILKYRRHLGSVTHLRETTQQARREQTLREARLRRGMPPAEPAAVGIQSTPAGTMSNWALLALQNRYWGSAIRLSARAVRRFPASAQPWVALFLSLTGPLGRAMAPAVLHLRQRFRG